MHALRQAEVHPLQNSKTKTLSVIQLSYHLPNEAMIGKDMLFVRAVNAQLFDIIRRKKRAVLIGNPGIAKSM